MEITYVCVRFDATGLALDEQDALEQFARHLTPLLEARYPGAVVDVLVGHYPALAFSSRWILEVACAEGEDPELPQDHEAYALLKSFVDQQWGHFVPKEPEHA
jgi:hypothetical protein